MYSKVLTHLALTNMPFINGLRAFERHLAASNDGEMPDDEDVLVSYELEADDDTWLALADAWDPERDLTYVREQIQAQLNGYALDDMGELFDAREGGVGEDLTPAHVFIMGMTGESVLLCAHAAGDAEEPQMHVTDYNGDCAGWVAGFSAEQDGEVVLDPFNEWVAVRKAWIELSREFTIVDGLPISGGVTTVMETEELTLHALEERVALLETTTTSPRGGDGMADGNDTQTSEDEVIAPPATPEGQVTLSREELDQIADARAQAVLDAYRQEQEEGQKTRDEELAATRRQLHEMTVRERIAELEEAGHAPAVVRVAREIMLADVRHEPVLSLSREEGEVSLSASDIVSEILGAIPETALALTKLEFPVGGSNGAPDSDDVQAQADQIIAFAKGE